MGCFVFLTLLMICINSRLSFTIHCGSVVHSLYKTFHVILCHVGLLGYLLPRTVLMAAVPFGFTSVSVNMITGAPFGVFFPRSHVLKSNMHERVILGFYP